MSRPAVTATPSSARRSATARAAKAEQPAIDIVTAMNDPALFADWFKGESWNGWRAILKAAFCLPMSPDEVDFFRTVAERDPPQRRVKELWCAVGRRGGKDSIASIICAHSAALFSDEDHRLRPGERALVMCLAVDREQARIVLGYTRAFFTDVDLLKGLIQRETAAGLRVDEQRRRGHFDEQLSGRARPSHPVRGSRRNFFLDGRKLRES
jgi:hypothetical protein